MYTINLTSVTRGSFSVQRLESDLVSVVEETTETTTESGGTTTKTTRTQVTRGAWTASNDLSYYWIALSDVEG